MKSREHLRENIKRLAGVRDGCGRVDRSHVRYERQFLWRLVHESVCEDENYAPELDQHLAWAAWFLRSCCEDVPDFPNEEAVLMLILGKWQAENERILARVG